MPSPRSWNWRCATRPNRSQSKRAGESGTLVASGRRKTLRRLAWCAWVAHCVARGAACPHYAAALETPPWHCRFEPTTGALVSLRPAGPHDDLEFVRPGAAIGPVRLVVRNPGGPWREAAHPDAHVAWRSTWAPEAAGLRWEIEVRNVGPAPLELGDLALPLPLNGDYVWDHAETFERRVFRHAQIAGHGSFMYWLPVRGDGPMLVLLPVEGARFEYFTAEGMDYAFGREQFAVYLHARASTERATGGSWRQAPTSRRLEPGDATRYALVWRQADSAADVRRLVVAHEGVDVAVAPGMTIPRDLDAQLLLTSHQPIRGVAAEHPSATTIVAAGPGRRGGEIYRVQFRRLGENWIDVRYGDDRTLRLEFFVTEPLETLVKKRAAFIVARQQHRDPNKWYDGLYSLWDRRQPVGRNLLGPDHLAGSPPYAVSGSDDPCNGKSLLVAEKNVAFPQADEVASLEYFVDRFVWGKHQRTEDEHPFPFGIYGADSWQQNRFAERDPLAEGISRPGGPSACRMWRTFDYPTYFALYYNLYRIARQRPDLVQAHSAEEYLDRAYGTARAYFEVPAQLRMEGGWSFTGHVYWQYTVGNFHEKYLLPLIEALDAEGRGAEAAQLRAEWEKKVKYFIYDSPWPFASEMPIDSTAYESTYAAAKYALQHGLQPDDGLWHDRNLNRTYAHPHIDPARHREFLQRQHAANLACRGALEAHYWALGSDFRGCGAASYTLSYMSQMGGWAVLDYALQFAADPIDDLRLGYASLLSSWALLNSGDAESQYGYWTPGALHDGAMSWGFQPRYVGSEWFPTAQGLPRGAWPLCGEADHGLVAGIEAARTVLVDDPDFGLIAYGGAVEQAEGVYSVVPRDGVRQRLSVLLGDLRVHLELNRDGFAAERPMEIDSHCASFTFQLEPRAPEPHATRLTLAGLPPGDYVAEHAGAAQKFRADGKAMVRLQLAVDAGGLVTIRRASPQAPLPPVRTRNKLP